MLRIATMIGKNGAKNGRLAEARQWFGLVDATCMPELSMHGKGK
jgi:hypothetical protein